MIEMKIFTRKTRNLFSKLSKSLIYQVFVYLRGSTHLLFVVTYVFEFRLGCNITIMEKCVPKF